MSGFFRGLFGDPARSGLAGDAPAREAPPLPEMIRVLHGLTDDQWGLYAFSREALKGRFSTGERLQMAAESAACGRAEAARLRETHGPLPPLEYARRMGLKVEFPDRPIGGSFVIFAQFSPPDQVRVFRDALDKAGALLAEYPGLPVQSVEQVSDVLLAHELFHRVEEERRDQLYTRTKRVELWKLGPLKNASPVSCLSEIAGMAFAKELCGLDWSPYLLDVLLVYGYNAGAAANLYQGILRVAGTDSTEKRQPT